MTTDEKNFGHSSSPSSTTFERAARKVEQLKADLSTAEYELAVTRDKVTQLVETWKGK